MNKKLNYLIKSILILVLIAFTGCEKELYEDNLRNERPKINLKQQSLDELLKIPLFNDAFQKLAKTKSKIANKQSARTALEDQYDFTIVEDEPIKIITDQNGILYYTILIKREGEVDPLKFENLVMKIDDEETTAAIFKYTTSEPAKYLPELETYRMNITDTQSTDLVIDGKTFMANSNNPCFTSMTIMCFQHNSGCTPTEPHVATAFCMEKNTCSTNYIYGEPGLVCLTGTLNTGGGGAPPSNPAGPTSNNNGNTGASANGGITLSPIGSDPTYTQIKNIIRSLSPEQQAWYNSHQEAQPAIDQYLTDNDCSEDSVDFTADIIDAISLDPIVDLNALNFVFKAKSANKIYNDLDSEFLLSVDHLMDVNLVENSLAIDPLIQYFSMQCAVLKFNHPNWSDARIIYEATKELVHIALDALGLIPVGGELADLTNGLLYLIEGDGVNASLSVASAVPIAGWASVSTKYAMKIIDASQTATTIATKVKLTWKVVGNIVEFGNRNQLRKVLGITASNIQAHHLIPWSSQTKMVVQKAAKHGSAFHMNEALNGIAVAAWRNQPNHNTYNNIINSKLDAFRDLNPNATPQECYEFLTDLIEDIRTWVINNPNSHLNDLVLP